jgi:hypothetical protein
MPADRRWLLVDLKPERFPAAHETPLLPRY